MLPLAPDFDEAWDWYVENKNYVDHIIRNDAMPTPPSSETSRFALWTRDQWHRLFKPLHQYAHIGNPIFSERPLVCNSITPAPKGPEVRPGHNRWDRAWTHPLATVTQLPLEQPVFRSDCPFCKCYWISE